MKVANDTLSLSVRKDQVAPVYLPTFAGPTDDSALVASLDTEPVSPNRVCSWMGSELPSLFDDADHIVLTPSLDFAQLARVFRSSQKAVADPTGFLLLAESPQLVEYHLPKGNDLLFTNRASGIYQQMLFTSDVLLSAAAAGSDCLIVNVKSINPWPMLTMVNIREHYSSFLERRHAPAVVALEPRIGALMDELQQFPVCYNRTLLEGSLAYCLKALSRQRKPALESEFSEILRNYVGFVEGLVRPFAGDVPSGWTRLDFTLCSDRFDNVQQHCNRTGILPALEEMTLEDIYEETD